MTEQEPAGWGFPANSRKAHYFEAGTSFSICGSYGFYFGRREPDDAPSPDDCKACRKKVGVPTATSAHLEDQ